MLKTSWVCDRCGKEQDSLQMKSGIFIIKKDNGMLGRDDVDFCDDCYEEFLDWYKKYSVE